MLKDIKNIIKKNQFLYNISLDILFIVRKVQIKYFYVETLKKDFEKNMGYSLDLLNPQTFNEKIQWLKVYYRDPIMTKCADKVAVRDIIAREIGKDYLIDVYGVYDSVDEIDISKLPNQFVLKPNHSSGRVIICKDKEAENWKENFKLLKKWMKENYYYQNGEWVYRDIEAKIICEKLLDEDIIDYKFFCFNGKPKFFYVAQGSAKNPKYFVDFLNVDGTEVEFSRKDHPRFDVLPSCPKNLDEMLYLARKLSEKFPFVRVDFYEIDEKIFFSELTFFPGNGMIPYNPIEWDRKLGDMLDLSNI